MNNYSVAQKSLVVLEVIGVTFIIIPLLTLGIYRLFPGFEAWQMEQLGFPFPVFVYVIMVALPLLIIFLRRKSLADFGIVSHNVKNQLDITATCFIPVVLGNLPLGMGVDHTTWRGALILAVAQILLLFALAWLLRKKPSYGAGALGFLGAGLVLAPELVHSAGASPGKVVVLFLTYALFVGFGEEILYRGYMHSRLNEVFGKPYTFYGVAFGWGALITALLFGFTHVGILRWILGLNTQVTLAWGFWTVFSGLVFGFVREKSGSILPSALLHGLPQAMATVAMLFI